MRTKKGEVADKAGIIYEPNVDSLAANQLHPEIPLAGNEDLLIIKKQRPSRKKGVAKENNRFK